MFMVQNGSLKFGERISYFRTINNPKKKTTSEQTQKMTLKILLTSQKTFVFLEGASCI